jgi:negative regulator of sigma-B (phosphoserine phosphatase)
MPGHGPSQPCRRTASGPTATRWCCASEGERTLVAVIDGLGHGEAAALAAGRAVDYLRRWPLTATCEAAMHGVHEALRGTRGAAASGVPAARPGLVCCGVGNVEIRCFGGKVPILLSPGVLGARVQQFRMCRAELTPGSRLVLFSDGISQRSAVRVAAPPRPRGAVRRE